MAMARMTDLSRLQCLLLLLLLLLTVVHWLCGKKAVCGGIH
jgi:hypothetical protein